MAISKKNQNAINTVISNGGVCYPRELAKAELTTAKSVKYPINGEVFDITNITESELSSRKFYEYSARYGFVFDLITAICTEHPEWVFDDPNLNFYVLNLSRNTSEQYALDGIKGLSGDFWENVSLLCNNPEIFNIPILQPNGTLTLARVQPVIITLYKDDIKISCNSKGASLQYLKNLLNAGMITRIEVQFFKPLFSGLLERGSNWIALPKAFTGHIIKVIENHKDDPAMHNKRDIRGRPSVETVRKAIMYLNMHESEKATTQLNLNLLDFCLHVLPSELNVTSTYNDNGEKISKLYIHNYYRVKEKIELIFYLFNCMHKEENLKGFKFTTGNVFINKPENKINVTITRDNNTVLEYTLEDPNDIDYTDIPF
ncbi:MAG: hypothetical protein MJ066_06075 [Clostridia bacterium]|nr:hypothetical protein [Clostridia bacterium]